MVAYICLEHQSICYDMVVGEVAFSLINEVQLKGVYVLPIDNTRSSLIFLLITWMVFLNVDFQFCPLFGISKIAQKDK